MSAGKWRRREPDSYHACSTSCSYYPIDSTGSNPYKSQSSSYASGSASISRSRLLDLSDGNYEETEKPKVKRARKGKDPSKPEPEKRAARLKKTCPRNILDRVERVLTQRFCMIERRRDGQELREEFDVLGSTGNVYTIVIDKLPSCNCPDALKGNHCKHILFIFLKVLQVPQRSTYWYQKALLTSELEEIFRDAPPAPNAVASARVRDAYARAAGKASSSHDGASDKRKRILVEEDLCAACYEEMYQEPSSNLVWCEECGNALHKGCFQQWSDRQKLLRQQVTCVYCRALWTVSMPQTSSSGLVRTSSRGYINLSGVAGLSPVRDTSTYYRGPRKGQHYMGSQKYDDD